MTFLWDECPRCFYLKIVHKIPRPAAPFPGIFNRIDRLMKGHFENRRTSDMSTRLPDGVVKFGDKWVTSSPIALPNHSSTFALNGRLDSLIEFVDGSYGIIDFKTTEPKPEHIAFYSRQLHAYALALENPAPGKLWLSPISRLGLLCVEPVTMNLTTDGLIAWAGEVTWLECPRDDGHFQAFLGRVIGVLEAGSPPQSGPTCSYCTYRDGARTHGL